MSRRLEAGNGAKRNGRWISGAESGLKNASSRELKWRRRERDGFMIFGMNMRVPGVARIRGYYMEAVRMRRPKRSCLGRGSCCPVGKREARLKMKGGEGGVSGGDGGGLGW